MIMRVRSSRSLALHGVVGGLLAGIGFALVHILISAALDDNPLHPLRAIGSMVLGSRALSPEYPLITAAAVGLGLHLTISAIYGVAFLYFLALIRQLTAPGSVLMVLGAIYAMVLWVFNFVVISPMLFPQIGFSADSATLPSFWVGFCIAHFFYGFGLGAYAAAVGPHLSSSSADQRPVSE